MELTEENTKLGFVPLNSREDHHWVEKLFPPYFTLQNLLENQTDTSEKHSSASSKSFTGSEEPQRDHRRQIYLTALKKVQHTERLQNREALARRIIRQELPASSLYSTKATPENPNDQSQHCSDSVGEKQTCIWNEMDITKLRTGFAQMARDQCKLQHKLSCTEEQLKAEGEQRRRLQGLLEELEEKLSLSNKKAVRQSLLINDLKTGNREMNDQLHKLAIQVRETEEEVHRCRTALRRAKEDMRQIEQERSNLAKEVDKVQAQQEGERDRLEKVAQINNEAALLKLQRELEKTRAELGAERDSHARSRAALDLLRRHFSGQ